jgi:hypothetical protein
MPNNLAEDVVVYLLLFVLDENIFWTLKLIQVMVESLWNDGVSQDTLPNAIALLKIILKYYNLNETQLRDYTISITSILDAILLLYYLYFYTFENLMSLAIQTISMKNILELTKLTFGLECEAMVSTLNELIVALWMHNWLSVLLLIIILKQKTFKYFNIDETMLIKDLTECLKPHFNIGAILLVSVCIACTMHISMVYSGDCLKFQNCLSYYCDLNNRGP